MWSKLWIFYSKQKVDTCWHSRKHTQMSYEWNFPQTKRLMDSLHTCHSSHWWWGFVCLLPIQGFFTPHIGPHIDVVITSSPPSFHLFQFGTCSCRWAKNMTQKESSNFELDRMHTTYCKNLSKSKVIRTIVSLGKYSSSSPVFPSTHVHANTMHTPCHTIFPFTHVYANTIHTPCHTILFVIKICFTTQQCCFHSPSLSKELTHTPTKQHKLTKHYTSHNSLSSLQHSSPSTHHPLQRWHHSAYNPSFAFSWNPDLDETCQMKSIFTFVQATCSFAASVLSPGILISPFFSCFVKKL
jgi:hypothetical protein